MSLAIFNKTLLKKMVSGPWFANLQFKQIQIFQKLLGNVEKIFLELLGKDTLSGSHSIWQSPKWPNQILS